MAAGDPHTLTRTVTLGASGFVAGQVVNSLAAPAHLESVASDNANVVVVATMLDGIPKRLALPGSVLTVALLNQAASSQTATITVAFTEVDSRFASAGFPQF